MVALEYPEFLYSSSGLPEKVFQEKLARMAWPFLTWPVTPSTLLYQGSHSGCLGSRGKAWTLPLGGRTVKEFVDILKPPQVLMGGGKGEL